MITTFITRLAVALAVAAIAPIAQAHAALKSSSPAADATVSASPAAIVLTFSEALEPAFSTIVLKGAAGQAVAMPGARTDPNDAATLRAQPPALAAGTYSVQWTAVGRDGHRRTGVFRFTVQ